LSASWSALSLPEIPMCLGIQIYWIWFFPLFSAKNVSSWINFGITVKCCIFVMAIKLLSESPIIIHFVLVFVYYMEIMVLFIAITLAVNIDICGKIFMLFNYLLQLQLLRYSSYRHDLCLYCIINIKCLHANYCMV
jgi:hypothetical protein